MPFDERRKPRADVDRLRRASRTLWLTRKGKRLFFFFCIPKPVAQNFRFFFWKFDFFSRTAHFFCRRPAPQPRDDDNNNNRYETGLSGLPTAAAAAAFKSTVHRAASHALVRRIRNATFSRAGRSSARLSSRSSRQCPAFRFDSVFPRLLFFFSIPYTAVRAVRIDVVTAFVSNAR